MQYSDDKQHAPRLHSPVVLQFGEVRLTNALRQLVMTVVVQQNTGRFENLQNGESAFTVISSIGPLSVLLDRSLGHNRASNNTNKTDKQDVGN